jgi:hypothetical protein
MSTDAVHQSLYSSGSAEVQWTTVFETRSTTGSFIE